MNNIVKKMFYFILMATLLTACHPSKNKINKQIVLLEQEMTTEFNLEKVEKLLILYQQYIKEFPQDSMSAEYLFRSGKMNLSLRKGNEALSDFTNLINKYPYNKHLPDVYYYKAFILEDIIYDIAAARVAYYDFINRYPTHKLASDAALAIRYLGKSPEEIIASFEENEKHIEE